MTWTFQLDEASKENLRQLCGCCDDDELCCSGNVPTTLYATVAFQSGGECLSCPTSIDLVLFQAPATPKWQGGVTADCGVPEQTGVGLIVECFGGYWEIHVTHPCGGDSVTVDSSDVECDPFEIDVVTDSGGVSVQVSTVAP